MPRTTENRISEDVKKEISRKLLEEFKKVDSNKSLDDFFKKFMTASEKDLILRRIAIMKLLSDGKKYSEIKMTLRVSDDTISRSADIMAGRGYGQNPNRKKRFSKLYIEPKRKRSLRYKGVESITKIFTDL